MFGTNAKMNEFQALMGILLLRRMEDMIEKRRKLTEHYRARLDWIPRYLPFCPPSAGVRFNYTYMPIEVDRPEVVWHDAG